MKLSSKDIKKIEEYFARQKDVVAVYLYGSFAYGNPHKRSDIDFGVLFEGKDPVENFKRLGQINSDLCGLKPPAEPEARDIDLNQSPVYLLNVVQGKLIYARDEIERVDFEVAVMNIFRDTQYLRDLKYDYMNKSFKEGTYGYKLFNN